MRQLNQGKHKQQSNQTLKPKTETVVPKEATQPKQVLEPKKAVEVPDSKPVEKETPATPVAPVVQPTTETQQKIVPTEAVSVPERPIVKQQPTRVVETSSEPVKRQLVDESKPRQAPTEAVSAKSVVKHPPIKRAIEKDHDDFKNMSALDKLSFKDLFVNDGTGVKFNSKHQKTVAKNLSKGIMDQVVDDLKRRHRNVRVWIGDNPFTIRESNDVFSSPTSTMRFLLLDQLKDENTALQLARQLFLEKHPNGEKHGFNHSLVRTDERDVYAVLLASKSDPTKELLEKVEELLLHVNEIKDTSQMADQKLLAQTMQSNLSLGGLHMVVSTLLLERLGLTQGAMPQKLPDVKAFINQENVVALSDTVTKDISIEAKMRQEVIARSNRGRTSRLRGGNRQNQIPDKGYDR